ncbi:hypothetical protein L915_20964 [Phytophthora nicotianae]|uniref:Uncharacterized protein n=2 Tax=Phytophthora nicotianae TaxID=4792 RepID=W2FMC8_PHYNI|nr:hypothetical protein L915_20964 [Phytophthora nicotianae]
MLKRVELDLPVARKQRVMKTQFQLSTTVPVLVVAIDEARALLKIKDSTGVDAFRHVERCRLQMTTAGPTSEEKYGRGQHTLGGRHGNLNRIASKMLLGVDPEDVNSYDDRTLHGVSSLFYLSRRTASAHE